MPFGVMLAIVAVLAALRGLFTDDPRKKETAKNAAEDIGCFISVFIGTLAVIILGLIAFG
jgi:hypothetical protein